MSVEEQGDDDRPKRRRRTRRSEYSPYYKGNNEGGYGNPPIKNQFNGKAGPGRPTKGDTLAAAIGRMLKKDVRLTNGGSASYFDALALAARDTSLQRKVGNIEFGFRLSEQFGPKAPEQTEYDLGALTDEELSLYGHLFVRIMQQSPRVIEVGPLGPLSDSGEGIFRAERGVDGHVYVIRIANLEDVVTITKAENLD